MAHSKHQRITPTGQVCTSCKSEPGYVELDTLGLACFETNVVNYYALKMQENKKRLLAARAYEIQHDLNRSV